MSFAIDATSWATTSVAVRGKQHVVMTRKRHDELYELLQLENERVAENAHTLTRQTTVMLMVMMAMTLGVKHEIDDDDVDVVHIVTTTTMSPL